MFDVWHLRYVVLMESSARSLSIVRNKFKPHRKSPASYASQILRAHRSCELGLQPCLRRRHAQADRRELWGWLLMTNRASAVQQREGWTSRGVDGPRWLLLCVGEESALLDGEERLLQGTGDSICTQVVGMNSDSRTSSDSTATVSASSPPGLSTCMGQASGRKYTTLMPLFHRLLRASHCAT